MTRRCAKELARMRNIKCSLGTMALLLSQKEREKNVHNLKRIGEKYLLTKIVNICPGDAHFEVKKGHLFCQVTNNKVNRNEIQNNTHVGSDL